MNKTELAKYIDHTKLNVDLKLDRVELLCLEAIEHTFASVCIPPYFIVHAGKILDSTKVKVGTVAAFPFGYAPTPSKVEEIKWAATQGADEVDFVINIPSVLAGDWNYVKNDIGSCIAAAHLHGALVKVILETAYLNKKQIVKLCKECSALGANFVKTSTGFAPSGAKPEIVELMRKSSDAIVGVKASGGIKTKTSILEMIDAGASRIGTSSAVSILGKFN